MFARLSSRVPRLAAGAAAAAGLASWTSTLQARADAAPTASGVAALDTASSVLGRIASLEQVVRSLQEAPRMLVISPTFYPSLDDVRCQLGIEACKRAKALGIPLLLVDASPPEVRAALEQAGAIVHRQTRPGRKGAALRECVEIAQSNLPADGVICYQELEKVEMIGLQREVAAHVRRSGADVVVPRREDTAFRRSYPIEQYHQENFANLFLDSLGAKVGLVAGLDWTFGPVAFRASAARHWLQCDGELWDAQINPFVRAHRWGGARVEGFTVSYSHPVAMKREEEGVPAWGEKRLMQLNFLFKHVAGALKEDAPPAEVA